MKVRTITLASPACFEGARGETIHKADHLEYWYDRGAGVTSWVVARFCEHGDQMGPAYFDGTQEGRDVSIRFLYNRLGEYDDVDE